MASPTQYRNYNGYNGCGSNAATASASSANYGAYESSSYSSNAITGVDPSLLQHENPNNCTDLAPALPLEQYRLNVDNNPHVIKRKPQEKVQYTQEVAVKYLKPPGVPRGGDIIIRELPSKQVAPAPPLVVRQPGPKATTPPPCVIRECPPQPPAPLPGKTITIPGKVIPPPARKVIVEKLPPTPAKPQQVFIERWLPYGPQSQRIIYQPSKATCIIPDPKNVVIQWEAPDVEVRREVKNLGVFEANPQEYLQKFGSSLVRSDALPELAQRYSQTQGIQLAAQGSSQEIILEGDVQALRLIDLDKYGLGYLKARLGQLSGSLPNLAAISASAYGGESASASYATGYENSYASSSASASASASAYETESYNPCL